MPIAIRIPTPLRPLTGGRAEVHASGRTVGEVLSSLYREYDGLRDRLCDGEGRVRRYVNIYLNDEDVRFLQDLDTPVQEGDRVSIVPAIAGGARPADSGSGR